MGYRAYRKWHSVMHGLPCPQEAAQLALPGAGSMSNRKVRKEETYRLVFSGIYRARFVQELRHKGGN